MRSHLHRPGNRRHALAAAALVALFAAACTSAPKKEAPAPAPAKPPVAAKPGYYKDDGPGDSVPANIDAIPDAVPRPEPLHRFANRPYTVFGREYVPATTLRPYRERGIASWYGRKFHGEKTSTGETYDMYAMTAAHPTLPLPSYARVTGVASGKSVVVRVNDRGPFLHDRLIDLSYAAAHRIGIAQKGSGEVIVEAVLPGEPTVVAAAPLPPVASGAAATPPAAAPAADPIPVQSAAGGFVVQLGAFASYVNAQNFLEHVQNQTASAGVERAVPRLRRALCGPRRGEARLGAAEDRVRVRVDGGPELRPGPRARGGAGRATRIARHVRYNSAPVARDVAALVAEPAESRVPRNPAERPHEPTRRDRARLPLPRIPLPRLLRLVLIVLAFAGLAAAPARAQLTIEIVGGAGTAIPIAIVPFENEGNYPLGITGIVGADLARSGLFRLTDTGSPAQRPYRAEDVRTGDWRARGADAVVVGTMRPQPDGRIEVRFALVDAVKGGQVAGMSYLVTPAQFRATAHKIADVVYQALTGDVGVFSTRIAYITKQGSRYQLMVADADGGNPQAVVSSNEPLLSPSWSPDGTRLAYVSLENRKPVVYIQSLATGQRQVLANFRGSNSAPTWSPDGRRLAVTLTKDGGSQLYLINADGGGAQRLMSSPSIDTEANFTPDGRSILFTSDRGGTPQIYRLDVATGAVQRMTFEGNYNVAPRPLPDGKGFAFVRREDGRFRVAIQDYATRQVQVLTSGPLDESPSVSPNSKLVLYAAVEPGGRGILAAVSADGRVKQRLVAPASDVREPAWGPLPR